jgi:hypothetical protein
LVKYSTSLTHRKESLVAENGTANALSKQIDSTNKTIEMKEMDLNTCQLEPKHIEIEDAAESDEKNALLLRNIILMNQ